MNVLQAIQYIIKSWNEVTAETICNCWNHTKILSNTDSLDDIETDDIGEDKADDDFVLDEISRMLKILNLPNLMEVREFLNIPEEDIIYEIPEDIHGLVINWPKT